MVRFIDIANIKQIAINFCIHSSTFERDQTVAYILYLGSYVQVYLHHIITLHILISIKHLTPTSYPRSILELFDSLTPSLGHHPNLL